MKKFVFAFQVLALAAIVPVYVVLELNHTTGKTPDNISSLSLIKKSEEKNIQTTITSKNENEQLLSIDVHNHSLIKDKA